MSGRPLKSSRKTAASMVFILIFSGVVAVFLYSHQRGRNEKMTALNAPKSQLQLVSQVFRDGGNIPPQYSCKGQNVNPPLNISGVPPGTKSLVLIMHDPDAPGADYTHWVVYDIPSNTAVIAANSVPMGALQGLNSSGKAVYTGPCPPSGTHHYKFDLYALDKTLGLTGKPSRHDVESALKDHILGDHTLTGLFSNN